MNTCNRLRKYYNKCTMILARRFHLQNMTRSAMLEEKFGRLEIKLSDLLDKKGISKNKLSHKAEMSWNQINNYCRNDITRLDTYVLCKLCTALDCKIEDLLEFIPCDKDNES